MDNQRLELIKELANEASQMTKTLDNAINKLAECDDNKILDSIISLTREVNTHVFNIEAIAQDMKLGQYRPYQSMSEFLADEREHGGWLRLQEYDCGYAQRAIYIENKMCILTGGIEDVEKNDVTIPFDKLLKDYIWVDGTPCGVMVC